MFPFQYLFPSHCFATFHFKYRLSDHESLTTIKEVIHMGDGSQKKENVSIVSYVVVTTMVHALVQTNAVAHQVGRETIAQSQYVLNIVYIMVTALIQICVLVNVGGVAAIVQYHCVHKNVRILVFVSHQIRVNVCSGQTGLWMEGLRVACRCFNALMGSHS